MTQFTIIINIFHPYLCTYTYKNIYLYIHMRRMLEMRGILDSLSIHDFFPASRPNSNNKSVHNARVSCHPDTEIVIAGGNCYRAISGGTMPVGHSSENIRSPLASYPQRGLSRYIHVIHGVHCPPAETFE